MGNSKLNDFKQILEEAEVNFTTGRYENAANTFELLSTKCIKMNKLHDSFYFLYRALISWENSNNNEKISRLYKKIGIFSLHQSLKLFQTNLENSFSSIEQLEWIIEIIEVSDLLKSDDVKSYLGIGFNLFDQILKSKEQSIESKIKYAEKAINLCNLIDDDKNYIKYSKFLVKYYEILAEQSIKLEEYNPEEVGIQYYEKARAITKSINDKQSNKNILAKINALKGILENKMSRI